MTAYVLRRLAWMVPTLLGITMVVFLALHAAPGDPSTIQFRALDGTAHGPDQGVDIEAWRARFRAEHRLDQPLWKQYVQFLGPFDLGRDGHAWFGGNGSHPWTGVLALDFGEEFHRPGASVSTELARRLRVSVPLSFASILLTYLIALPLGALAAIRRDSALDRASGVLSFALHSVPTFWAGLMLILVFGRTGLGWLPVIGLHDRDAAQFGRAQALGDTLLHSILPVATLTYGGCAYLSRQMRAALLEVIDQDYITTARAKGLSEWTIVSRHALRNALVPVITLFASVLPVLIGGSVIVETVFDLPGIGRYVYEGLLQRDYNIVMAATTLSALLTLLGILLSDVLLAVVDPRIRHG